MRPLTHIPAYRVLVILAVIECPATAVSKPKTLPDGILSNSGIHNSKTPAALHNKSPIPDSTQFLLGEQALLRQRYDSALSHNLAAHVPPSGAFRDALLAQRSSIFAKVWPASLPRVESGDMLAQNSDSETPKPVFDWGMGTSHSRGLFRSGAWRPDGWQGMGYESRYWMYDTYARQSWPISIRGQALNLAAQVNQSTGGGFSTLEAAVEAEIPEGILENLSLAMSGGLRKSEEWGSYQSFDLLVSKGWYWEGSGLGLQAGLSREWDRAGRPLYDNLWAILSRDHAFENGHSLEASFMVSANRMDSQSDWILAPVFYVDDASKAQPTHFRAPDFRDTLSIQAYSDYPQYSAHAGALQLNMNAPQSHFSLSPALTYGIFLPDGFKATARASYAVDLYPASGWDWVPMPASEDLDGADLVGLALNRADGKFYAVALGEGEDGSLQETYATSPLEQRRANRMDQRAGLEFSLGRSLPHGYALSMEASAGLGWSNLPHTSPIDSQPWHWGLTFHLSRSSIR